MVIRPAWPAAAAAVSAALASTLLGPPTPLLVWNASASSPIGLYAISSAVGVERGDRVLAWAPAGARRLAAERGYAPKAVPLVKQVAAAAGDRVCADGPELRINDALAALRRRADAGGRPMPWWRGCGILPAATYLLLTRAPDSFDGRYFGPVGRELLIGKATLLWPR